MKLLIYSHSFSPAIGGVERDAMRLALGLSSNRERGGPGAGDTVTVVTQTQAGDADDLALPFEVVRAPGLARLWRLVGGADVVHLAGPALAPLVFALLRRKPLVIKHHGYQAVCPNGLLFKLPEGSACPGHFLAGRLGKCLRCAAHDAGRLRGTLRVLLTQPRRALCRRAAVNVCVTHHVKERLRLPRSEVIYYGVPDAGPVPGPDVAGGPVTFAYVGRLVAEKGLPLLLQAAARLRGEGREFRVVFVGDGPERPRLERMVASQGLQEVVTFTGFLHGAELEAVLRRVEVVVMPSIWEETAGLAAMEHMMRGRVVIAADAGGLGEVVGSAGLKFAPRDAIGLAICMRRILDDAALRREMGVTARRHARALFRLDHMVAQHLDLFGRLSRSDSVRDGGRRPVQMT